MTRKICKRHYRELDGFYCCDCKADLMSHEYIEEKTTSDKLEEVYGIKSIEENIRPKMFTKGFTQFYGIIMSILGGLIGYFIGLGL